MDLSIDIKIKDIKPMTVAYISMKGNLSQIPESFGKLYSWIVGNNYNPVGPSIVVFYTVPEEVPDEDLRWELRSQLSGDVSEAEPDKDSIGVKKLAAAKIAAAMYEGPYENTVSVYIALNSWVTENGYEINGPVEELYYNNPLEVGKEALTEIRIPVHKR